MTPDVVLPGFSLYGQVKPPPHNAHVVAESTVALPGRAPIRYRVYSTRKGTAWWLLAALPGDGKRGGWGSMRASDGMRTTSSRKAATWIAAVEAGAVTCEGDA